VNKVHELKVLPKYFRPLQKGEKTFEIRKDDRGYMLGDILVLRGWCAKEKRFYCVAPIVRRVCYITHFFAGLKAGYCVLGLERCS
jgi:hypothetical protein